MMELFCSCLLFCVSRTLASTGSEVVVDNSAPLTLNCDVNLQGYGSGVAECDSGCEYCNFSLIGYGTVDDAYIRCLAAVPCSIFAEPSSQNAFEWSVVQAQTASRLTMQTIGGSEAWVRATIYAPTNGGHFRFEASSQNVVENTRFYASDSGLVDFIFHDSADNYGLEYEFSCMDVYASSAERLSILLRTNTSYILSCDSRIECPLSGACVWLSDATYAGYGSGVVDIIATKGTPQGVELTCDNSEACEGVYVYCNEEADSCQMAYDLNATEWHCDGVCAIAVTTQEPTSTTTASVAFSSTQQSSTTLTTEPSFTSALDKSTITPQSAVATLGSSVVTTTLCAALFLFVIS